jgi:hypothetical protein
MGKWIGWRVFPPKEWWTGGLRAGKPLPLLQRDPIAHTLGAAGMMLVLILVQYVPAWLVPVIYVGFIAALRQEWLVEMFDGGYKAWRALWCTLVNIFTALFIALFLQLF